jgi:hypothetical protein
VALIEKWLRGEIEIPEIADKWTTGPVVRMKVLTPQEVSPGQDVQLQVVLTNNKTGHDFPTGPLDMIESWVELRVADENGAVLYNVGGVDKTGRVAQSPVMFKADGFDRKGELIDRHNLWDLVGASYKRSLYPGMTDTVQMRFRCPSMERGRIVAGGDHKETGQRTQRFSFEAPVDFNGDRLTVTAILWYRKANPDFLERVYGVEAGVHSPATQMTTATSTIRVVEHVRSSS